MADKRYANNSAEEFIKTKEDKGWEQTEFTATATNASKKRIKETRISRLGA